ncbi:hypothetical protein TWF730_004590 [Orbilia blumenaviensis]|uniref:Uncharacterized protein n=1 Tax=Orbilia blumenaviensis TaxID=1796055 RepID=A0AAV9U0C7_9PEZI
MYFIKQVVAATVFVFSIQTTLVAGQSASLIQSYLKSEKKIAHKISPYVDSLDYNLEPEKWAPVFRKVVSTTEALNRAVKIAERRFSDKLPKFDEDDAKDIEREFLAFADEAVDVLATFTKKSRPAAADNKEIFQKAATPFNNFKRTLKSYLGKLLDTIPSASDSVIVSMQLLQDSVDGLVLIFEGTVNAEDSIVVTSHGAGSVKIIIE